MLLEVVNFFGGRSMRLLVQQAAARRPLADVGRVVDRLVRAAAGCWAGIRRPVWLCSWFFG